MRTAGTAEEKVAQGNLLPIVTTGNDVEDIGDAEAGKDYDRRRPDGCRRDYSTWRKNPPADFLQMQEPTSRRAILG